MAVVFDSTILSVLLNPQTNIPLDPDTNQIVDAAQERVEGLVRSFEKSRTKIIIPTPVVAEVLTIAGSDAVEYFDIIGRARAFEIAEFDTKAAIELAIMNRDAFAAGDKRSGITAPYQKIKVDRQILAIAKTNGCVTLYSGDGVQGSLAKNLGMTVIQLHEIPIPDDAKQGSLDLESHEDLIDASDDDEDDKNPG